MEPAEVERLLRSLANIALHMSRVSDDLRASIVELQEFNRQQLGLSERLIRLLESSTGQGENGHGTP